MCSATSERLAYDSFNTGVCMFCASVSCIPWLDRGEGACTWRVCQVDFVDICGSGSAMLDLNSVHCP